MSTLAELPYRSPEWWHAVRTGSKATPEPEATVEPYPEPEHTSRDPWPEGFPVPRAVDLINRAGGEAGWVGSVTYSRGCQPHAVTGKPGDVAHWVAIRMLHPDTRARVVMVYRVTSSGTKAWDSILLTNPGRIITQANVSEAKAFILAAGRVLPSWVDAIKARTVEQAERAKASAKRSTGKRTESGG